MLTHKPRVTQIAQSGKAATQCRFFASLRMTCHPSLQYNVSSFTSLRMTCHPERSEGSAFLRAAMKLIFVVQIYEAQIAARAFNSFTPSGTPQPATASNPGLAL